MQIYFLFIFLKEICAVSKISKKEIGRCFKLILKALETSVDLITTGDFMSRFCSNLGNYTLFLPIIILKFIYVEFIIIIIFYLGLPIMVQRAATHIARRAVEMDIVAGRSPISVAAAAIYMASQVSLESKIDVDFYFLLPFIYLSLSFIIPTAIF